MGALALLILAALPILAGGALAQEPDGGEPDALLASMDTAFTYQGQLMDDNNPANGVHDFEFRLFDAAGGGSLIDVAQSVDGLAVSDGLFTVDLDFGPGAMDGQARWLEISVRRDADASYTSLSPRVALTPFPHALALPGLWTQQNAVSPNLVGGAVEGAVIDGGGHSAGTNQIRDDFGAVGGGNVVGIDEGNSTYRPYATVGGGEDNTASGPHTTVAGGQDNTASEWLATVAGGGGNTSDEFAATVGGGTGNTASGESTTRRRVPWPSRGEIDPSLLSPPAPLW